MFSSKAKGLMRFLLRDSYSWRGSPRVRWNLDDGRKFGDRRHAEAEWLLVFVRQHCSVKNGPRMSIETEWVFMAQTISVLPSKTH